MTAGRLHSTMLRSRIKTSNMRLSLNSPTAMLVHETHAIPLSQLEGGHRATITELVGNPDQVHRLKELGLQKGACLEMVRSGSPCIVRLLGHTLCIRGCELLNVLVRPGE